MAGRGPAPTPTRVLQMRGSHRAKERPGEPMPPVGVPSMPAWLTAEAKKEWKRLVKLLVPMGVLTESDGSALAQLCQAWADFVEAQKLCRKEGVYCVDDHGAYSVNPALKVKHEAHERWRKMSEQFGLTPASRTRLRTIDQRAEAPVGTKRLFAGG